MAQVNKLNFKKEFLIGLLFFAGVVVANEKQLYKISLNEPFGSQRTESAKLLNADSENAELVVEGHIDIKFREPGQTNYDSIVVYIADKNGYRVKYQLKPIPEMRLELSGASLKIAAG